MKTDIAGIERDEEGDYTRGEFGTGLCKRLRDGRANDASATLDFHDSSPVDTEYKSVEGFSKLAVSPLREYEPWSHNDRRSQHT